VLSATHVLTAAQHCAQTLLDFNGGSSCVQVYVNLHDFFINRQTDAGAGAGDDLSVPNASILVVTHF
jgi:hypothetical protein